MPYRALDDLPPRLGSCRDTRRRYSLPRSIRLGSHRPVGPFRSRRKQRFQVAWAAFKKSYRKIGDFWMQK